MHGGWQQEAGELCTPRWQLAHRVPRTQHPSAAPRRASGEVPTSLLLAGSLLLLSPQQGGTGLCLAVGAAGCLTPLVQSVEFRATGGKKTPKPGSGIHVVPEHPRWFSPGSKRGESCVTDRKQEHRAMGTGCVRPKPGTKARFPNSYLNPGDCCLLSVSYIKSGFSGSPSVCSHSTGAASPVSAPRGEVA